VREQVEQELVRVLSADPGSNSQIGSDASSCVPSRRLRDLPTDDRNQIRDQIHKVSRNTRQATQRTAIARLILGAVESGETWECRLA
jgi:hypothetical protein